MNRETLTNVLLEVPATIQAQELNLLQALNESAQPLHTRRTGYVLQGAGQNPYKMRK